MPREVRGQACVYCGHVYKGETALRDARDCEKHGPPNYWYEVGTTWRKVQGGERSFEVVKRYCRLSGSSGGHTAYYTVEVSAGDEVLYTKTMHNSSIKCALGMRGVTRVN